MSMDSLNLFDNQVHKKLLNNSAVIFESHNLRLFDASALFFRKLLKDERLMLLQYQHLHDVDASVKQANA